MGPRRAVSRALKSDLRNHRTIVRPRSYDGAMFTQITPKTEGPHGVPSDDTPAEADPHQWRGPDRPPGKGSVFSEEAENGTFRPPVASKQTKQILNLKNLKNGLKLL